jgi:hypothetical protein
MMRTCTSWVSAVMHITSSRLNRHGKPSGSSNQHRRANIGRFHVVHDVVMTRVGGVHANVAFRVMAMRQVLFISHVSLCLTLETFFSCAPATLFHTRFWSSGGPLGPLNVVAFLFTLDQESLFKLTQDFGDLFIEAWRERVYNPFTFPKTLFLLLPLLFFLLFLVSQRPASKRRKTRLHNGYHVDHHARQMQKHVRAFNQSIRHLMVYPPSPSYITNNH